MSETTSSGWRRFFGLPSTTLGWASFGLVAAFFALAIIGVRLGIDTRWVNIACLLSSGVTGLVALVFKHERSWLVWTPVIFAVLAFGGELTHLL